MRILAVLCLFSIFYSPSLSAKKVVAEIVLVKGHVTRLDPGAHNANEAKKGDMLKEDTSIVTGEKSIVRIKYKKDGSIITLGQKGKFVIEEVKSGEAGVVSLLVGKLRSKVTKEKEKQKNKLFIKTRTAAIGVRGTDFYTVYNPQNQVTSLVTFDGEVAMKKFVKKRGIVDSADAAKHIGDSSVDIAESLNKALDAPDTVLVKKGRYSGVNSNFLNASKPVKISPKQYLALKENDSLVEGADVAQKEFTQEQIEKAAHEINKVKVADPIEEGFYNEKTGEFAPKSGGLLDSTTGIYVQPSKTAKFNEQLKVYEADSKIGNIDSAGNYIAPTGLALTATSGFVVADASNDKIAQDKDKLNENIATAIPIKDKEEEIEKKIKTIAKKQVKKEKWIKNHFFSFSLAKSDTHTEYEKPFANFTLDRSQIDSDSGLALELYWRQLWTSKVDTLLQFGFSSYKFNDTGAGNPTEGKSDLIRLSMHTRYWYKSWMAFRVGLALEDIYMGDVFYDGSGNNYMKLRSELQKMIVPGIDFKLIDNRRFTLNLSLSLLMIASPSENKDGKNSNGPNGSSNQGGANLRLQGDFKVFGNKYISPFLDVRHMNFEYDSYNGTQQSIGYDRKDIGVAFSFEI